MKLEVFALTLALVAGSSLLVSWNSLRNPDLFARISPFLGKQIQLDFWSKTWALISDSFIFNHPKTPWAPQVKVFELLTLAGKKGSISNFRIKQLICISLGFALSTAWVLVRSLAHKPVGVPLILAVVCIGALGAGWLPVWQLKHQHRIRSENVNAVLPIFLELMAFTVAAGEPLVNAMQRVTKEISGPFADEVKITTQRIKNGENLADGFRYLDRQFSSAPLSRAVRTLDMAMERGTPLADILRAQASDARANYARELMVLAGKKETTMLLPVVFFILPMIVAVAIYPGLIALNVL